MQYLNTTLWDTFPEDWSEKTPEIPEGIPTIKVVTGKWQRDTCSRLGLTFHSSIRQPRNLVGQPISEYLPWETESIIEDGNCLYRCLLKIITSQESHVQLRKIITNFIASEGTTTLGWYFRQKGVTPCTYFLDENLVFLEGTWDSDVEIMAASAILDADIFVSNNDYLKPGSLIHEVRWSY